MVKRFSVRTKPFLVSLLILVSLKPAFSQKLSPGVHDFGKVKLWNNPTATFVFKNNTKERIIFLPIRYQRNLKIALPEGFIEPGEKVEIQARYYTESLGSFSIDQELYVNVLAEPLHLRMKGRIQSFHPNALTVCPILDKTPAEKKRENNSTTSLTVYNHKTGLTVNGYDI